MKAYQVVLVDGDTFQEHVTPKVFISKDKAEDYKQFFIEEDAGWWRVYEMIIERTICVLGIQINQESIDKFEKRMEKLLVNEQIKQLMVEYYCGELENTERPKKPWYRKERW